MKYDHSQICTAGGEIVVGQQYQYKEEGYLAAITILADNSDKNGIGFKVRIDDPITWPGEVGDTFNCWAALGKFAYSGMWRIWDVDEYVRLPVQPHTEGQQDG